MKSEEDIYLFLKSLSYRVSPLSCVCYIKAISLLSQSANNGFNKNYWLIN